MKLSSISNEQRNRTILKKIIRYCDEIEQTKVRFNLSFEMLQTDFVYKNAVAMCVLQIGELVTHLTDDFKAKNNSIPWQEIKAMRNVAAHHYAEFSLIVLWETITDDVPKLRNQCS